MSNRSSKAAKLNSALAPSSPSQSAPKETGLVAPLPLTLVLLLLLVVAVVIGIRLRLLDLPLERDEGEYAYAGQLLLQGVPPYEAFYSMKWPGTFAAYAVLMAVFGQTSSGIHFGLLLVTLGNAALVFLLTRRIGGPSAGAVAAATFALLSITPHSFGLAAHATHFVLLPALAGILLLQNLDGHTRPSRVFIAGVLLGLAALMKQAGAAFGLFAAAWVLWQELSGPDRNWLRAGNRLVFLAVGGLLPLVTTGALLAAAGVFGRFWLWTIRYSRAYVRVNTVGLGAHWLVYHGGRILKATPGLWALAAAGLMLLWWDRSLRQWLPFVVGLLIFSFIGVCPSGYFRGHYFLLLFPVIGLLSGIFTHAGARLAERQPWPSWAKVSPIWIFLLAAGWSLYSARDVFFFLAPKAVSRQLYGLNPFPESVEIGRYLRAHCGPGARIAVMGSEPQLYFYSHRRSATGYIYTYPLTEPQPYAKAMQQDMISEITLNRPEYVVFVFQRASWLSHPQSDPSILKLFIEFNREHLEPVALVDIFPDGHTEYSWSHPSNPRSDQWLQVYKSRDAAPSDPGLKPLN
ncbi:MAG TPA: glycosyltransferase family 39 protein [Candidatus Binatia bacterium]|jgi:hypothetical protein|nr:glycosyltransferase family 39 protein [Candidatus Binatia bacterium]